MLIRTNRFLAATSIATSTRRSRCDGRAPWAPYRHTTLANFHITSDVDLFRSGPRRFSLRWRQDVLWQHLWNWETNSRCRVGSPTIPGKSFDSQLQFDVPRIDLRHHLDCSGRLHPIWRPNGVVTRANSTAEDSQKDTFLPSTLSADAAHVLPRTHPPDLLSVPMEPLVCESCAPRAAHTASPVEPWPKPSDRGCCMRYQPCQAVMSLRDSPPKTHLCAVPLKVRIFALSSFNCTFRKAIPWTLFLAHLLVH